MLRSLTHNYSPNEAENYISVFFYLKHIWLVNYLKFYTNITLFISFQALYLKKKD